MSIEIANIKKSFGRTQVLNDISLDVPSGQMVALLGPSGSGKTTLLRIIAGLEHQTSGHIRFHGTDVSRLHARDRKVGFVFQHYALFRHMTVFDNIAFGLTVLPRRERPDAAAIKAKVTKLLEMVQLAHLADRFPAQLSGGQKQRVALARALVIEPPLLMFDEPLSNLDAKLRVDMRVEIRQLQRANGTTSVYVTHDQEEAFSISDRVAIMHAGKIMQLDTPENLYQRPANAFVARFVGFENLISMKVVARDGSQVTAEGAGGVQLTLGLEHFGAIPDAFVLACRADGLSVTDNMAVEGIPTTLGLRTYLGRAYQYQSETAAGTLVANGPLSRPLEPGSAAKLVPVPDQCTILAVE